MRCQHTTELRDRRGEVLDMAEREGTDNEIEAARAERQRVEAPTYEGDTPRALRCGSIEHARGLIEADDSRGALA